MLRKRCFKTNKFDTDSHIGLADVWPLTITGQHKTMKKL